jgi:hypothetical protein
MRPHIIKWLDIGSDRRCVLSQDAQASIESNAASLDQFTGVKAPG